MAHRKKVYMEKGLFEQMRFVFTSIGREDEFCSIFSHNIRTKQNLDPDHKVGCIFQPMGNPSKIGWRTEKQLELLSGFTLGKPGKFFKKFFPTLSTKDIEIILKAFVELGEGDIFRVVEGEDIRKWYNGANYLSKYNHSTGTLGGSCMRSIDCQPYFDIYVHNPDQIKMVIMLHRETGKLQGRALLWFGAEDVKTGEHVNFMDRVYGNDNIQRKFFTWAEQNGFIYKDAQNYCTPREFNINGVCTTRNFKINLPNMRFKYYPYLDSMYYTDGRTFLSNTEYVDGIKGTLRSTGGKGVNIYDTTCIQCGNGIIFDEDEHYSYGGEYYCADCHEHHFVTMPDGVCAPERSTFICDDCGERHYKMNMHDLGNGYSVCDSCRSNYVMCEDCGSYAFLPEITTAYNNGYALDLCGNCLDNYTVCEVCGEMHYNGNLVLDNDREVCYDCYQVAENAAVQEASA